MLVEKLFFTPKISWIMKIKNPCDLMNSDCIISEETKRQSTLIMYVTCIEIYKKKH